MKTWINNEKGDDTFIAYANEVIYKGNPKPDNIDKILTDLKQNISPGSLTGTPLSYISQINLQEGKSIIELEMAKDSSIDLRVKNDATRNEIFEYLKTNISNSVYKLDKVSSIRAGKKPMIAFFVVLIIFIWTLYIAIGIESGNDYDVTGQRYNSIAGIVLGLAGLGVKKVILIFGSLLLIASIAFYKKAKNPPVINRIILHSK